MNIDSFIIINKFNYWFSPASSLKSQLHSLAGSSIKSPFEFQEFAAIPPKKLFGSSALCIITKVEPKSKHKNKNYKNIFVITIRMKCYSIESNINKLINKVNNCLGWMLYYECNLLNLTLLFLKSFKIKVEY